MKAMLSRKIELVNARHPLHQLSTIQYSARFEMRFVTSSRFSPIAMCCSRVTGTSGERGKLEEHGSGYVDRCSCTEQKGIRDVAFPVRSMDLRGVLDNLAVREVARRANVREAGKDCVFVEE